MEEVWGTGEIKKTEVLGKDWNQSFQGHHRGDIEKWLVTTLLETLRLLVILELGGQG